MNQSLPPIRSALFLPAANPRAIEKARTLPCDMVILDLEDAVKPADKDRARAAAIEAVSVGFGGRVTAIRINATGSEWHAADLAAMHDAAIDLIVLPKVETPDQATACALPGKGVLAMIETPAGVLAAPIIAAAPGVRGLLAGTNDLAASLRLPDGADRRGLTLALQSILLAARAAGILALDGVWNRLDDEEGLARQCTAGRAFGFDGKSLIHPSQIDTANRAFGATDAELEDARALVAAATGGAERFRGRMIESMHVEAARRLIDLAGPRA
jgi:citrate lyase subunit beta/citryl-CoA lyase